MNHAVSLAVDVNVVWKERWLRQRVDNYLLSVPCSLTLPDFLQSREITRSVGIRHERSRMALWPAELRPRREQRKAKWLDEIETSKNLTCCRSAGVSWPPLRIGRVWVIYTSALRRWCLPLLSSSVTEFDEEHPLTTVTGEDRMG